MKYVTDTDTDKYVFFKRNKGDKVWWVDELTEEGLPYIGRLMVSFDNRKIFNVWADYPKEFSKEEKELFDKENPYWKEFFHA